MGYHINTPGRICYAVDDYAEAQRFGGGADTPPGGSANGSTPSAAGVQWGELQPIAATLAPPEPFPIDALHPEVRRLVDAACKSADAEGMQVIAYHCALAAIASLGAADFQIQTLARNFRPFSVYTAGVTPSGTRKDSVFGALFDGHKRADGTAVSAHTKAKRARDEFFAKPKPERKGDTPPPRVNHRAPRRILDDATAEAWLSTLGGGSPYAGLITPEAQSALGNWSFNKERMSATFSAFNALFTTGRYTSTRVSRGDVNVVNAAPSICLLTQPGFGDALLLSEAAIGGFGARTLIALVPRDGIRLGQGEGSRDDAVDETLEWFTSLVLSNRARQDHQAHIYTEDRVDMRHPIELSEAAYARLQQLGADMYALISDSALPVTQSRLSRTPELVATLAAVETALLAYAAGYESGGLVSDVDAIERAFEVMEWENAELLRLERVAAIEDEAYVAQHTLDRIKALSADFRLGGKPHRLMNAAGQFQVRTMVTSGAALSAWRNNPARAAAIVKTLEGVGAIQEVKRGWFAVHPDIAGEVSDVHA